MLYPVVLALLVAGGAAAAERVKPGDAERAQASRAALEAALAILRMPEAPAEVRAKARLESEAALKRVEGFVDTYYHARNLRDPAMRAHVLALRPVIGRLFAADGPLVLRGDVIHPRPAVARTLAEAARAADDRAAEVGWLRALLATMPDDRAALAALREAHLALGQIAEANTIGLRLKALDGAVGAPR